MPEFRALTTLANQRFNQHLELLGGEAPPHRVEFSKRITTSWALIYYRRHVVRLSPYLFLLEGHELHHGSHWRELDATLRHEAAHAAAFARARETAHGPEFHRLLARLGMRANGGCDLGPENATFRYVYACPGCDRELLRRQPLRGNYSCGDCHPGSYEPTYRMSLRCRLPHPWRRVRENMDRVRSTLEEAERAIAAESVPVELASCGCGDVMGDATMSCACVASS